MKSHYTLFIALLLASRLLSTGASPGYEMKARIAKGMAQKIHEERIFASEYVIILGVKGLVLH